MLAPCPQSSAPRVCQRTHIVASEPPLALYPPTRAEVALLELEPGLIGRAVRPLLPGFSPSHHQWPPHQTHEGKPGAHPLLHPSTHGSVPSPTGAWSWSSCTDTACRPAERGLGLSLSWPSGGGQGIRVGSQQLPPLQPLSPTFRVPRGAKIPSRDSSGPQSSIGVGASMPVYLHFWGPRKYPLGGLGCLGRD